MLHRSAFLTALGILSTAFLFTPPAAAHISLDSAGTHLSRHGDADIKDGPCGLAGGGGQRGENVYTYQAGETITVELVETIPHPGYFRFAFDDDGDDDFVDPASIKPLDPNRACPFNAADKCGESDFYNSPTVLPGMDNLDPHVTAGFGTKYSWQVKLPDVACDNCTLQIIQVMEDTIHGAYNPKAGDPADTPYIADIYYQCIDLVLLGDDAPAPGGDGGDGPASGGDDHEHDDDDGGCSVAPGATSGGPTFAVSALGLVALAWRRLRRYQRRD